MAQYPNISSSLAQSKIAVCLACNCWTLAKHSLPLQWSLNLAISHTTKHTRMKHLPAPFNASSFGLQYSCWLGPSWQPINKTPLNTTQFPAPTRTPPLSRTCTHTPSSFIYHSLNLHGTCLPITPNYFSSLNQNGSEFQNIASNIKYFVFRIRRRDIHLSYNDIFGTYKKNRLKLNMLFRRIQISVKIYHTGCPPPKKKNTNFNLI